MTRISVAGYEPAHLSWSTFDGYRSCGERFKLQKVLQKEQRPNWSAIGGSAIHSVIEDIEYGRIGTDEESLTEAYIQQFTHHMAETKKRSPSFNPDEYYVSGRGKKNAEFWLKEGPIMARRWVDWREQTGWTLWHTNGGLPGIEVQMNFSLPGDIPIKAFIDSVWVLPSGEVAVVDVKSGRIPEYPEQLGLYKVGMETLFDVPVTWGYFWDAAKGTHGAPIDLGQHTPESMGENFAQMITAVNAGVFIGKPAMACHRWCGVAQFCSAVNGELASTVPSSSAMFTLSPTVTNESESR